MISLLILLSLCACLFSGSCFPPGLDGCRVAVKRDGGVIADRGETRHFDWSVCPETQWSALASAQRALDCTAPMIALKGQQKAHLPLIEWERGPNRSWGIDFHSCEEPVLAAGQWGFTHRHRHQDTQATWRLSLIKEWIRHKLFDVFFWILKLPPKQLSDI